MKFPSIRYSDHYSLIGLADIIFPGLLLCFALRYDALKQSESSSGYVSETVSEGVCSKLKYFPWLLYGWVWFSAQIIVTAKKETKCEYLIIRNVDRYFLSILAAIVISAVFIIPQTAVFYWVAFTLTPLLTMAHFKVGIWSLTLDNIEFIQLRWMFYFLENIGWSRTNVEWSIQRKFDIRRGAGKHHNNTTYRKSRDIVIRATRRRTTNVCMHQITNNDNWRAITRIEL